MNAIAERARCGRPVGSQALFYAASVEIDMPRQTAVVFDGTHRMVLSAPCIRSLTGSLRHFLPWNRYSLARKPLVKVEWRRLPYHPSRVVELGAEDAELGQVRIIQLDRRHVRQAI